MVTFPRKSNEESVFRIFLNLMTLPAGGSRQTSNMHWLQYNEETINNLIEIKRVLFILKFKIITEMFLAGVCDTAYET